MSKGRSRGAATGISPVARVIALLIAVAGTAQAHVEHPMSYDEFVRQTGWQLLPVKEPARSVVNAR